MGGRCEVFGNPKFDEKILHLDVEGMYQQCMEENLPTGAFYFEENVGKEITGPGFYFIEINYKSKFPILPIKEDKLYFKEGRLRG